MKLNYKRTILVGFAFFLISAFWQAYDTIIPLILTNKFAMSQAGSGFIMALDNIFAVFMLPLFGTISDKTRTKFGKRTPYIFFGTICAVCAFFALSFADNLALFIILLLLALISMATFRSPAVALMPDVTVKPLRSQGNAVINLMGTAGGIIVLAFATVFHTGDAGKTDFSAYIAAVCGVMLVGLIIFLVTVREVAWSEDMKRESDNIYLQNEGADASCATECGQENKSSEFREGGEKSAGGEDIQKLPREKAISLIFILASVALWFIGYNAVISKYSIYATNELGISYSLSLLIAQAAAVVSYIPVGLVAAKIGRKKTILAGVAMLFVAFGGACFITSSSPSLIMTLLFALAGVAWATINVNSFPMVVELAKGGNVGRYTGYYYTASMAAQIVTPILSGLLMDYVGMRTLFPYATVFVFLAFVTMMFVRHGDNKPQPKQSMLENFDNDN